MCSGISLTPQHSGEPVSQCYARQYKHSLSVLADIALARSEDELFIHQAVWLQQPACNEECEIREKVVKLQLDCSGLI